MMIVENGTEPEEHAVATTLRDLTTPSTSVPSAAPPIIFIGLDWRPQGWRVPERSRPIAVARGTSLWQAAMPSPSARRPSYEQVERTGPGSDDQPSRRRCRRVSQFRCDWVATLASIVVALHPTRRAARRARTIRRGAQPGRRSLLRRDARDHRRVLPLRQRERVRLDGPSVLDDVPGYTAPPARRPTPTGARRKTRRAGRVWSRQSAAPRGGHLSHLSLRRVQTPRSYASAWRSFRPGRPPPERRTDRGRVRAAAPGDGVYLPLHAYMLRMRRSLWRWVGAAAPAGRTISRAPTTGDSPPHHAPGPPIRLARASPIFPMF